MESEMVCSDIFWYNGLMSKIYHELKCCIEGCTNPVLNKKRMLCNRHYLLLRRHGSPTKQLRRSPEGGAHQSHYLYKTWDMMRQRCTNKNFTSYTRYGGRGIRIYPEWENSFVKFREYVEKELGSRPEGYTLDRIDNDQGYIPGNLRWASKSTQQRNRNSHGESGVLGVYRRKDTGKWVARLSWGGKTRRVECDTVEEAKAKRKEMEANYGTKKNSTTR